MPDKTREMSLETRLWASLRMRGAAKSGCDEPHNGRISRPRVPGSIVGRSQVLWAGSGESSAFRGSVARKKRPLRFGRVPQNPAYLVFIRTCPCILIGLAVFPAGRPPHSHVCSGKIEAAHTEPHGRWQKAVDESALPICTSGHRTGQFAHHKTGRKFWSLWGLDREKLVAKFNALFLERAGALIEL